MLERRHGLFFFHDGAGETMSGDSPLHGTKRLVLGRSKIEKEKRRVRSAKDGRNA